MILLKYDKNSHFLAIFFSNQIPSIPGVFFTIPGDLEITPHLWRLPEIPGDLAGLPYMTSLLHFSNIPRQLRSSTSQQLSIPRTKLNVDNRAFSVAAPFFWNELPTTLKSCESLASFRKHLKTYLFKIAFPP